MANGTPLDSGSTDPGSSTRVGSVNAADLSSVMGGLDQQTGQLAAGADKFASAMLKAFTSSATGGKQFDGVLKSLGVSLAGLAAKLILPAAGGLAGGLQNLFSGLFGGADSAQPFASGGVIASPTYFPLGGGLGLAGEAGAEAILPLARGPDGRLGVASGGGGGGGGNVTVQIVTPDPDSFRRSEAYLSGQIARAVARGQRVL